MSKKASNTTCPCVRSATRIILSISTNYGWYRKSRNTGDLEERTNYYQEYLSYKKSGNMVDLEEGLSFYPIDRPLRSTALNDLRTALDIRYRESGDTANVDESIRYRRKSLSLCSIGDSNRPASLNHLSIAVNKRYKKSRNMAGPEHNIRDHQESLSFYPVDHPLRCLPEIHERWM
ncbi:hypothetical protein FRB96_002324 [Tulasnella sp. 330]|nr:hypothetical protein FRB96_002324 [Tulasnella sp. 330]KAG8876829.1 hypothetical protein FRB97_003895 [Tulasnella sp. 331]